jgi:hypothetical protein
MDTRTKLKGVFTRFISWAAEKRTEYPEMKDLFDSFLQTANFELFCYGIQSSSDFQPIKEICKKADEDEVNRDIRTFIKDKMEELEVEQEIDEKDIMRLIKYLRLFGDIANNGL